MELKEFKKSIKSDLCNIQNQSPFAKKKTLDRLNQALESCKDNSTKLDSLNEILFSNENENGTTLYDSVLLNLLSDSLERARTTSLTYLLEIKLTENLINKLIYQLEVLINNEQVEELRYLICKLILKIIEIGSVNSISMNTEKIIKIIKVSLSDNSPDQKEICSKLIQRLSDKVPNRIIYFSSELIHQLIGNLGNRQQRVRMESLQALSSLALSGSIKIINTLEPMVMVLATDNSPQIRIRLLQSIEQWCTKIPTTQQYFEFLLPVIIELSISDIKPIRNQAIITLNSISSNYYKERENELINNNNNNNNNDGDNETLKNFNISQSILIKKQFENKLNYFRLIDQDEVSEKKEGESINDDDNNIISLKSRQLILQYSQQIMKRFYRCFHEQELEQNIRDFKQTFLLAFIGYLGSLPSIRFIDAIIEIITIRKVDHFDQIEKKNNEIIYILGLLIDQSVFVPRIIEKFKEQLSDSSSSSIIDIPLLQIQFSILKQYFIGLLNNPDKQINSDSITLIIQQFKLILFKENSFTPIIIDFLLTISKLILKKTNPIINQDNNNNNNNNNNTINEFSKLLILLDINNGLTTTDNQSFNQISNSFTSLDYQLLLEKTGDSLIDEIVNKDKNQLIKQKSHLLISNYLCSKLSNIKKDKIQIINEKIKNE
ncbi:hypothetical protein DDB_G0267676 [Dictyostelium discoideum AX4]|uniref:Dynein axonemal assembly factor 5 TPR repeats domain-containing protein n=1 Tax=Dictyostelium discoideum TaxID=44689 RepID=Q55GH3_DICDI|nr:hypothetical protein DDB_G0267676 [Dictyostelium discoideum AX4]EAL73291.1 hypothetical protein DDB_G0267676 [Dictyostelium discoideum AX4]|eukprot:XP_647211.1 hypothetical protein DDB_G0267676 [Dictyostelium discoideum AX4]